MDDDSSDDGSNVVYDICSDGDAENDHHVETEKEDVNNEVIDCISDEGSDNDKEEEEVCLLDIEDESEDESCSFNEEKRATTGKVEVPKPHHLVTFCTTRWYSAWLVMKRFHEVLPAIRRVIEDLEGGSYSFLSSRSREKLLAVNYVDEDELKKVVYMLWPIVEAIDYLQSNSALQVEVYPVLSTIISDYSERITQLPSGVKSDDITAILNKRIELFDNVPIALRKLYFDEFQLTHEVIDSSIEEVEQFFDQVEAELFALCDERMNS